MATRIEILQMVKQKNLPEDIPTEGTIDINEIVALVDEGIITANNKHLYGLSIVSAPRLTSSGEEELKQSRISIQIVSATHNVVCGAWKWVLFIAGTIIAGLIVSKFS